jgi:ribosome-associated protein
MVKELGDTGVRSHTRACRLLGMALFHITEHLTLPSTEIKVRAMPAQGAGGQHGNKASTAVQFRFDIPASSLPQPYKERLLQLHDHRITRDGVLTIKTQEYRSQELNKEAALKRLRALIQGVAVPRKPRRATKPTPGSHTRRLERKAHWGQRKAERRKVEEQELQ